MVSAFQTVMYRPSSKLGSKHRVSSKKCWLSSNTAAGKAKLAITLSTPLDANGPRLSTNKTMAAPDAKEKLMSLTKHSVRSVLLSSKEGLSAQQLQKDYQQLMLEPLPFQRLGYPNASALFNAMPDVCRKTFDQHGMDVYKPVTNESTAHIASMVSKQRSKKSKKGKSAKFSSYSRQPKSTHSFQASRKYVPSSYSASAYSKKAYNYNNNKYAAANISKKAINPFQAVTQKKYTQPNPQSSVMQPGTSLKVTINNPLDSSRPQTEEVVRSNLRNLLKAQSAGIWMSMLEDVYRRDVGINFPVQYLTKITTWTDIVDIQDMHGKEVLYPATAETQAKRSTLFDGEIRSAVGFKEGEQCDVYVAHIEPTTCKVYVHRADSRINTLTESMTAYFKSQPQRTYTNVPVNCVCAAVDIVYQSITRAYVRRVDRQKYEVELFYVDFGNTEVQNMDKVQPLPAQFTSEEAQAVPVRLHGLVSSDYKRFSKELLNMTDQRRLKLQCVAVRDGECCVTLFDADKPKVNINELLVHKTHTSRPDISPVRAPSPSSPQAASTGTRDSAKSAKPVIASLPSTEYWTVLVTHIQSVSCLYIRIKDESSASFNTFQDEVETAYVNEKPVSLLSMGSYYIACVSFDDDTPGWYRVKAVDLTDANTVCCEFIDYGFHHDVEKKLICPIINRHARIPCQARPCILYGLDQIKDDEDSRVLSKLQDLTDDKSLIAELISVEQGVPHVVLFDTSGDDDIEINKEVGKLLDDEALQALLPQEGHTIDVTLTYVERDGTFYVQAVGPANLLLQQLMNAINDYYHQNTAVEDFITNPQVGQVVCARYEGMWYRVTINKVLPEKKVHVFYGDYGNSATLSTRQLRRLPQQLPHAQTLPMQCMSCKLSGLLMWNDDIGLEAAELMANTSTFVLTTVKSATQGSPALVQLTHDDLDLNKHLLKIYEDSIAQVSQRVADCSVAATIPLPDSPGTPPGSPPSQSNASQSSASNANQSSASIANQSSASIANQSNQSNRKLLADMSHNGASNYVNGKLEQHQQAEKTFNLRYVSPPDVGLYWDVFVTDVSAPDHFIVVPHSNITHLNALGDKIHREYQDSPVISFTPQPGQLCAGCRAADGFWYRVIILPHKVADKYQVIFADYGNYDYIGIDRLRPLNEKFELLPVQAVKAALYDLEPALGNMWSDQAREDIVSLCNEKSLVATVRAVDRAKTLVDDGPSVYVELHDTSGEVQLSIDELLVGRGHAKYRQ